jgi:hypothetical protein
MTRRVTIIAAFYLFLAWHRRCNTTMQEVNMKTMVVVTKKIDFKVLTKLEQLGYKVIIVLK